MIGERETTFSDTNYGTLIMRPYNIDGNEINAFYDAQNNLVFILDNTISAQKPNVLLVINPDGDKKWDEILSGGYGVDLETIRPKVDNKYQKLDIEYSGLGVYEGLINAYNAGDGLDEHLNQLNILRDSAARHSAMTRLNVANEIISKTNATIVKTKESIVRLETRIKTLRSKLSTAKKEIGKVNTKQSASKILKLESQIEATNEKLKRAKKRLESAQKRLEVATVDAELASELLNQPSTEIKEVVKNKPVVVAPEYPVQTIEAEEDEIDNSEIKPLFTEDPQILNDDIAFKPISFDAPVFSEISEIEEKQEPVVPVLSETENKPVLESITPIEPIPEPIIEEKAEIIEEKPVLETMMPVPEDSEPIVPITPIAPVPPVAPVVNNFQTPVEIKEERSKPGFAYYILLLILILLSVFTLWLYQKNMPVDTKPVLTPKTQETTVIVEPVKKEAPKPVIEPVVEEEQPAFLDEEAAPVVVPDVIEKPVEPVVEEVEEEQDEEPMAEPEFIEEASVVEEAPVVMNAVPGRLNTSGMDNEKENYIMSEEEILAKKPIYEPGARYDDMFVNTDNGEYDYDEELIYEDEDLYY